jgi:hypothetical protein
MMTQQMLDVVAQELAGDFVLHRRVGLAADVVAELRLP